MTTFRLGEPDLALRSLVTRAVQPLETFGLLTTAEAATVRDTLAKAEAVQDIGTSATQRTLDAYADVAQRVINGKLKVEAVDSAVADIPAPDGVASVTSAIATHLIREANSLAFAHADTYVDKISAELDKINDAAEDIAPRLGDATNAEEALNAGAGDAWLELGKLHEHHTELSILIDMLRREAKKIPAADTVDFGAWWRTRKHANLGASTDYLSKRDPRLRFLDEALAGLYLPASEEEAEQVRFNQLAEQEAFAEGIRANR